MKRIFVEVDINNQYNKWLIESMIDRCIDLTIGYEAKAPKKFFNRIICNARFEPKLFHYIKGADEIYMSTSIIPIVGGTNMGSPELWNGMMKLAIQENITGKKIFNAISYKDIYWRNLDYKLVDKAFRKNYLYVDGGYEENKWEQVDIDKLIKEIKAQ